MVHTAFPFPASTFESPVWFALSLFACVLITATATLLARKQIVQLWYDRAFGKDAVWVINSQVLAVCLVSILAFAPEALYLIYYAEVTEATRFTLLAVKRACHIIAIAPALFWISNFLIWRTEILIRLRSTRNRVWDDSRDVRFNPAMIKPRRVWDDSRREGFMRFLGLAFGSAGLAVCVTLARLFQ